MLYSPFLQSQVKKMIEYHCFSPSTQMLSAVSMLTAKKDLKLISYKKKNVHGRSFKQMYEKVSRMLCQCLNSSKKDDEISKHQCLRMAQRAQITFDTDI